jgi:hypothetical protein
MAEQSLMFNERLEPLGPPPMPPAGQKYPADRPLFRGFYTIYNFAIQKWPVGESGFGTIFRADYSGEGCYEEQRQRCRIAGEQMALEAGGYYIGESLYDEHITPDSRSKSRRKKHVKK